MQNSVSSTKGMSSIIWEKRLRIKANHDSEIFS